MNNLCTVEGENVEDAMLIDESHANLIISTNRECGEPSEENIEKVQLNMDNINQSLFVSEYQDSKSDIIATNKAPNKESAEVETLYEFNIKKDNGGDYTSNNCDSEEKQEDGSSLPVITSSYRLLQCELCFCCFSTQNDFDIHRAICEGHSKASFICPACSAVFDAKDKLDNHIVCHEVSRPFSCKLCGSLFKSKKLLQSHTCLQKTMNLICNICGAEFSRLSSLKNHMKIHAYHPGRDFVVPSFCETIISDNSGWVNDVQSFPPLMPQLDIQNNSDWNVNLNESIEGKVLHDSLDISHETTPNSSYSNILDGQSAFQSDFENIDNISVHSDPLEMKHDENIIHENISTLEDHSHSLEPSSVNLIPDQCFENDTKKKPHSCKYCGVSFTREKALISHERFHQDYMTDILECRKCGNIFLKKEDLKTHSCSKNSQKITVNEHNPVTVKNQTKNVVKVHPPLENTYEPENIEYSREHYNNAPDSQRVNHKESKHTCEHCFKRFTTKQKKFRHMWIHRNKTFSCEVCSDTFATQDQLNEHRLTTHEGNTPHGCVICGKCFASRQGLWEHMRLHKEGSAPLQCSLCGKKFTSRQGYHIHSRTHTGERPYGCRYCWKAFRDGGTLRKHERIHTGERPHVCPICHRAFNQKVVLREHVRWLHAHHQPDHNQPFIPCPIPNCQHTLTDKEDLCAHIVKHSDMISNPESLPVQSAKVRHKKTVKKEQLPECNDTLRDNSSQDDLIDPSECTCEMCGETFPAREHLLSHVKIHI